MMSTTRPNTTVVTRATTLWRREHGGMKAYTGRRATTEVSAMNGHAKIWQAKTKRLTRIASCWSPPNTSDTI